MSLDKLAVIFIIIILPISLVLSSYTEAEVKTLKLQSLYDTKLYSATYDAIKAYQLNAFNEDTSDFANSKMRLVKAAANTFFNSIANNFDLKGYTKEYLQEYIPAVVFTMYDGYYIYSKYTNELDFSYPTGTNPTYTDNQELYGLKPYIYYTCRYQNGADDFVITYSLDNYITIQGIIGGNYVNDSGYVIEPESVTNIDENNKTLTYKKDNKEYQIKGENLKEYVGTGDSYKDPYTYIKANGGKYYYDESRDKWFIIRNDKKIYQGQKYDKVDHSAYYYYKEANEFTKRIFNTYKLGELKVENSELAKVLEKNDPNFKKSDGNFKIFDGAIEEPNSNFNGHRLSVIKYSIEKNLSIAIANYNTYSKNSSAASNDFQMPELKEDEWEKIFNNISVISFMQGLPMGVKTYNGCAVVPNNKNSEVVTDHSIYICTGDNSSSNPGTYYKPTSKDLLNNTNSLTGALNVDFERKYFFDKEASSSVVGDYYYPKFYIADYNSIVTSANVNDLDNGNIYKYFRDKGTSADNLATAYFTALGRERYSTYNVNKRKDQVLELYLEH